MAPVAAQELALRKPSDTRIVLDLEQRQITVVRAGQRWGPWPVAIGDPRTPTPKGTFSILSKQTNPVYLSTKGGNPASWWDRQARSAIATSVSIAVIAVNSGFTAHPGPIGSGPGRRSASDVCACSTPTSVNSLMLLRWGHRCRFRADQASGRTSSKISFRMAPAPCCLSLPASSIPMDSGSFAAPLA